MRHQIPVYVFLLATLLAACGSDPKKKAPPAEQPGVELHEEVNVLGSSARESLLAFEVDPITGVGELRFPLGDPALQALEPGAIVVSEPVGEVAPFGLLQRIESRREEGGEVILDTVQATLEEVFVEADIEVQVELKPDDIRSQLLQFRGMSFNSPATEASRSAGYDFSVNFDKVLIDLDGDEETKDDQLRIDGSFNFSTGVDAKIKIGTKYLVVPTLEHLKFVAYLKESVDLTLTGALLVQFEKEIEVARFYFGTITIMVGPVPVVFSVDLSLTVGAEGKVEARLVATAAQSLDISVGAEYRADDGWKNLSGFESNFDFPTPEITAAGSARAFATPRIDLKLYGLAGPYVFATAYVEADAALDRDPFWSLMAGLDLGVGFQAELPIIGSLGSWSDDFELFRKELGQSPNQAPTLEIVSPDDGVRLQEGDRLEIRLRASDREQKVLPITLKQGGTEVATTTADRDSVVRLTTEPLCVGTHSFEISVRDEQGATATASLTAVVENFIPTVTVRDDLLIDEPIYAGGYLVAVAEARDRSCTSEIAASQDLIEWTIDGQRVGSSGTLEYRIPSSWPDGREFVLEARYDDGIAVGVSEPVNLVVLQKPDGIDLPPRVRIIKPVAGGPYLTAATYDLQASAHDFEDGILSADVRWEFKRGGRDWVQLPAGQTTFTLHEIGPPTQPGGVEVRASVTDSAGQTTTDTISIYETVPG